ncbi:hypothetical protein D3C72_2173490 [compost metagenome]
MVLTLKEGTSTRNWSSASVAPWLRNSSPLMMSIGTAEEETVRGLVRLPSTETVSRVEASGVAGGGLSWASAAALVSRSVAAMAACTADANGEIAFGA